MSIVIGCSGSTGSSLLKTILNRHTQIFAGPEAGLFAYPTLFENWEKEKHNILDNLKTDGWQMRRSMALLQPAFGWKEKELKQVIQQSTSFTDFIHAFFAKPLQQTTKNIWVAKTPANAMGMAAFLQHCPNGKVVQTIRNPYDVIASLVTRGMNPYVATGYYVYNTAIATSNRENERYYQLKYEDLVERSTEILEELFTFLNLPFEPQILIAKNEKRAEPTAMKGWKHHETAAVKKTSIGRFRELPTSTQALISAAFASFTISDFYQKNYNIQFSTGRELCTVLDYNYLPIHAKKHAAILKFYYWKDRIGRIKHGFSEQFWNYLSHLDFD